MIKNIMKNIGVKEEKPQTSKTYIRKNADGSYAPYMSTPQGELMIPGAHTYSTEKGAQQALNKFNETHNIESNAMQTKVSAVSPGEVGLKKLAEQNENPLDRRLDELIAKGNLSPEEREEMRDTDPITYIPKKNDELRVMYQKEKDPEIKAAMKKALKKHASMMPSEPFAPEEEVSTEE